MAGQFISTVQSVLMKQSDALKYFAGHIEEVFDEAIECLLHINGRIAVTGMGKSGHVAAKVAATLSSTGSPAYFIHPAEASHGDLGMVSKQDAVIAFSNSGETAELSDIILYCSRYRIPIVAVTKNPTSFLGKHADYVLVLPNIPEVCPIGCAPTTSTTLQIALGDALALTLLDARGFKAEDFHQFHPGGRLGRKLLQVKDIMHYGDELPLVAPDTSMADVLCVMTGKGFGCVGVVEEEKLIGMVTDGDLRRHMGKNMLSQRARDVMGNTPFVLNKGTLAAKALGHMQERSITNIFIVENDIPTGIINIHDLLRAGIK